MAGVGNGSWLSVLLAACGSLLGACAGPTYVVQQYRGPPRPPESIAILRIDGKSAARLAALDGESLDAPLQVDARLHIELLPGKHSLAAFNVEDPQGPIDRLSFVAKKGQVYRVLVSHLTGPRPLGWRADWHAQVYRIDAPSGALLSDVSLREGVAAPKASARAAGPSKRSELEAFCAEVEQRDEGWRSRNPMLAQALARFDVTTSESIGQCWPGQRGAWALEFEELPEAASADDRFASETTESSGSGKWTVRYRSVGDNQADWKPPLYVNLSTEERERNFFFTADAGVTTRTPIVFDFDDDGHAEFFFPIQQRGPRIDHGWLLSYREGRIVEYPHLPDGASGLLVDLRDVDHDGRPDIIFHGPYVSFEDEITLGPELLAHSLEGGQFSSDDAVAQQFAKRQCPQRPKPVAVTLGSRLDRTRTFFNAACARIWGATTAEVRSAVRETSDALNPSDADRWQDADGGPFDRWLQHTPPLRLSQ